MTLLPSYRHTLYALSIAVIVALAACSGHGNSFVPGNGQGPGAAARMPGASSAAAPVPVQANNGAAFAPTTLTVRYTTAPVAGNVLIVFLHNNGSTSGSANSYTPPTGWTQVDLDTTHTFQTYEAFYHVAGASEPTSFTFTPSCVCRQHVWIALEVSGVDTTSPVDRHGFSFANTTTAWNTPSETPSQTGDLAIVAMLPSTSNLTWTNAAGWNVAAPAASVWSGEVLQEALTSTTTVSESSTLSASSIGYTAVILLNPSAGGAPTPTPTSMPTPTPTPGSAPALIQKKNGAVFAPAAVTVTLAAPVLGDVLVVFLHNNGNTSGGANSYTAPAGWTQIDLDTTHAFETYEAFYHVAGAGEPGSYAFTPACACKQHVWQALEFSGVNTTSPIDRHGFSFPNNTTSWTTPVETPSQASDLAVVAMLQTTSGGTWSNSAGWTVDISGGTWSGEVLHEALTSTAPVSESSTLSASSYGYAAIILLTSSGGAPPSPTPSPGANVDWPTWGMKPTRNSYNPLEKTLTTANVGGLHQIWQFTTGGVITAAPVVAAGVALPGGGTRDILYVGDHHANFYALDANSGAQVWTTTKQTDFVDPTTNDCDDQPGGLYGIGGSATIDRSSSRVYFVDGNGNLYAYDLATATQKAGPVAMYPFQNGVNITTDYGALNEDTSAGVIYVPGSAHCALANYGGVGRYSISTGAVSHFYTEGGPPNTSGGVWGPGGAVIDPRSASGGTNDIYFATAFGQLGTGKVPYSAVRLTSGLGFVAANNPVTQTCCPDLDFGDTPLVVTPSSSSGCGSTLVMAESKNAMMYVWNADSIGAGPIQTIALGTSDQNGQNIGTAAYDPTQNLVFMPNASDPSMSTPGMPPLLHGLIAFTINAACQLAFAWQQTVGPNQVHDGPPAPPTVANGVVYYSDGVGTSGCSPIPAGCSGTANFYAFNETNGATLRHLTFPFGLFTEPVVVNGKVYLTTWNGQGPGIVYGLGL